MIQVQSEISTFKQGQDEAFHEAWERYQRLLRKCPNHGLADVAKLNIFCAGLNHQWTIHLTATAGRSLKTIDVPTAMEIITSMAASDRVGNQPKSQVSKPKGVLELNSSDAILAQNKLMTQQIELLSQAITQLVPKSQQVQVVNQQAQIGCELCGEGHSYTQCPHASSQKDEELNL